MSVLKCQIDWAGEAFCSQLLTTTMVISGKLISLTFKALETIVFWPDHLTYLQEFEIPVLILSSNENSNVSFLGLEKAGKKDEWPAYRRIGYGDMMFSTLLAGLIRSETGREVDSQLHS
jgi:hypothetical protein